MSFRKGETTQKQKERTAKYELYHRRKWGSERERACATGGRRKRWRKVILERKKPGEKTSDNEKGGTQRDERWKPKYTDKTQRTERTRKEDERKSGIGEGVLEG